MPEGTILQTKVALTKPDSVRVAMPADEPALYALLMKLHDTNFAGLPFAKYLPISEEKIIATVHACCNGEGAIAGVIYGPDKSIIGSVGIFYTTPWWTDFGVLTQNWLFIEEDYRLGSSTANALFAFAEWHRADMSAKLGYDVPLETTILSNDRLASKEKLWARKADKIGAVFWSDGGQR